MEALAVIKGTSPAKDSAGNDLPETTDAERDIAWRERQRLWNEFLCPLMDNNQSVNFIQNWIATAPRHELSSELEPAKRQLLSKFDRAAKSRLEYLFDGVDFASNSGQRAARDAILRERQLLVRELANAGTVGPAETATNARIAALASVSVAYSPDWLDSTGEPKGTSCTATYTKGSTPWKLDLDVQNAGRITTKDGIRTRDDTYGPIKVEDFTHPEFELVARIPAYPIVNDVTLRLQRKTGATGHPAAGKYDLELIARNLHGPTVLKVTVTVA